MTSNKVKQAKLRKSGFWYCTITGRPVLTRIGFDAVVTPGLQFEVLRLEYKSGSMYQPELIRLNSGDIVSGPKFGFSLKDDRNPKIHNLFKVEPNKDIIQIENNQENYDKMRNDIKINDFSIFDVRGCRNTS